MILVNAGRSLAVGVALGQISYLQLWIKYLALGGSRTAADLLDYLQDLNAWPVIDHDIAARALNEHCQDVGLGSPVLYADEL